MLRAWLERLNSGGEVALLLKVILVFEFESGGSGITRRVKVVNQLAGFFENLPSQSFKDSFIGLNAATDCKPPML